MRREGSVSKDAHKRRLGRTEIVPRLFLGVAHCMHGLTLGCAVVEPGIEFVDDRLETDDGEETTGDGDDGDEDEDRRLEDPRHRASFRRHGGRAAVWRWRIKEG